MVVSPYGEVAQGFVLRGLYYNDYEAPLDKENVSLTTTKDIVCSTEKSVSAEALEGLEFTCENCTEQINNDGIGFYTENCRFNFGNNECAFQIGENSIIRVDSDGIELRAGKASISISEAGINLSYGSSSISISDDSISLDSGSITSTPPICKCEGGL